MTAIIILNWNGYKDTIECLESLTYINDTEFYIILVDNASEDESIDKISEWCSLNTKDFQIANENEFEYIKRPQNKSVILYKLVQNYGFSMGNNKGLEIATKFGFDYGLLLNNDTIVTKDFLSKLIKFNSEQPKYKVLSPLIRYFNPSEYIWNAGAKYFWGFRRYYYADKNINCLPNKQYLDSGYLTGCALLFTSDCIEDNKLLTERFFHGEEDFEFSFRMRSKKYKMACVLDSVIFHKVGMSIKKVGERNLGVIYIHYLQRFIDVRDHMSRLSYFTWRHISSSYILILLLRQRYSLSSILKLIRMINKNSFKQNGISKEQFAEYIKIKF